MSDFFNMTANEFVRRYRNRMRHVVAYKDNAYCELRSAIVSSKLLTSNNGDVECLKAYTGLDDEGIRRLAKEHRGLDQFYTMFAAGFNDIVTVDELNEFWNKRYDEYDFTFTCCCVDYVLVCTIDELYDMYVEYVSSFQSMDASSFQRGECKNKFYDFIDEHKECRILDNSRIVNGRLYLEIKYKERLGMYYYHILEL